MLVTNNAAYNQRARLLRSHGMTSMSYDRAKGHSTVYDVIDLGYNYRMDDIHAAIGIAQLRKIENDLQLRAEIRKQYLGLLKAIDGIIIPFKDHNEFSSNYILPVIIKDSDSVYRDQVRDEMGKDGIQTSVHYPAVHKFSIYGEFSQKLEKTEYVADNLITLPMYSKLSSEQVVTVVESLKKALKCSR
jgi:dTDP-4-amino-4,6-dideoxygalactose transaminase